MFSLAAAGFILSAPISGPGIARAAEKEVAMPSTIKAKELTKNVKSGLSWLVEHQLPNGGWGQGEESANMGAAMAGVKDKGNVADTCMATLALMRSGSTPTEGSYAKSVKKGVEFVLSEIEKSDKDSLSVTSVQGTRVQGKIGPYVDTFMSSLLLSELKSKSGDPALDQRVAAGLNKVLTKIEKNQRSNGTWDNQGWAPVLSQGIAAKSLNRAKQNGVQVSAEVLAKTEDYAQQQFDGSRMGGEGTAGIGLYGAASSAGTMRDARNTKEMEIDRDRELAGKAKDESVRNEAKKRVDSYEQTAKKQDAVEKGLVTKLADPSFVSGFGSNGGEEFLSYMLVSESLVAKGGDDWEKWDRSMVTNLNRVQNGDGSWSGHHCITGRTFVTSSALLVLMADRSPVPVASALKKG
jgi:hypothetical protein